MTDPIQKAIDAFLATEGVQFTQWSIAEATRIFSTKMGLFNKSRPRRVGPPSMSQVGKPFCQLHADKLGWPKEEFNPSFKVKMLYGDVTEIILMTILLDAGIDIVDADKHVTAHMNEDDVAGTLDLTIREDGVVRVWDIKSASAFSFKKKFDTYDSLKASDSFGYLPQLFGYVAALREEDPTIEVGGWIVMSKETGEVKVVRADPADQGAYEAGINNTLVNYNAANENNFIRDFSDETEMFNRKPTGNRKLGLACSYCSFKETCWPGLQYRKHPLSKDPDAYRYYTEYGYEEA